MLRYVVQLLRKAAGMCHEVAKLILEHTATFLERTEAIKAAIELGMPLQEIEAYLDWLDTVKGGKLAPRKIPAPAKGDSRKVPPVS